MRIELERLFLRIYLIFAYLLRQISSKFFILFLISACEDGIHADPNNCAQFYQCANGHQYPMQECPEGLLYNAEKEYCDWPENVDCSVSKWSCFKECVGGKWWNPMIRHKCWRNCRKGKMIETDMYKGFSGKFERKTCEEGIYKHPFR